MSLFYPWDEGSVERAVIRGTGTVGVAVIKREKEAVVAINERAGVQHLNAGDIALLDIQQVHPVRHSFKISPGKKTES
jgi:hypothetical protein